MKVEGSQAKNPALFAMTAWSRLAVMVAKAVVRGSKSDVGISRGEVRTRRWLAEDEQILAKVERRVCTCVMSRCTINGCWRHCILYQAWKSCLVILEAYSESMQMIVGPWEVSDGRLTRKLKSVIRLEMAAARSAGEDWQPRRNEVVCIFVRLDAASSIWSSALERLDLSMAWA